MDILQKAGVWRRKVSFYYHMKKGAEVAENYCELPVSAERYIELCEFAEMEGTDAYNDVWSALEILTRLQGYDTLIGFHLDLPNEADAGEI